jgi:hypothetical protein
MKLLTVVGELTVTTAPFARVAVSEDPGTWLGDQFAAVFQLPELLLVQVSVAPCDWERMELRQRTGATSARRSLLVITITRAVDALQSARAGRNF